VWALREGREGILREAGEPNVWERIIDGVKEVWSQNHKPATDNMEIFHKKVEEEKRKGRMLEMTYKEVKKRFKNRLAVASLGLVQEGGEKWRLVHDGTRVMKVHNRIKQRDKVLQACIKGAEVPETIGPGELILVNTCGTYGIGSAAYGWGRLGAAVQRSIHYLLVAPLATWLALFADDALMIAPFIKTILTFLRNIMKGCRAVKVSLHQQVGGGAWEFLRADAKAEGYDVCIGGWEVRSLEGEVVDTMGSRWFALRLDRKNAPWAFGRGEPYRTIASLEMLAARISVMLFITGRTGGGGPGVVSAGGTTDNKGNTFVVCKLVTTQFPLLAMEAELATIMEDRCLVMDLNGKPTDQNKEADALSNFAFVRFDVSRRIPVVLEELKFNVLHVLLRDGDAFYRDLQNGIHGKEKRLLAYEFLYVLIFILQVCCGLVKAPRWGWVYRP
jgi:hypothetical protein